METALIPVVHEGALQQLVAEKRALTPETLLQRDTAGLLQMKLDWYDRAVEANFIAWLLLTVRRLAESDQVWRFPSEDSQRLIEVRWIQHSDRLTVLVNGAPVCSTEQPGAEWLNVGQWLLDCRAEAARRERVAQRQAQHDATRARLLQIEALTKAV